MIHQLKIRESSIKENSGIHLMTIDKTCKIIGISHLAKKLNISCNFLLYYDSKDKM